MVSSLRHLTDDRPLCRGNQASQHCAKKKKKKKNSPVFIPILDNLGRLVGPSSRVVAVQPLERSHVKNANALGPGVGGPPRLAPEPVLVAPDVDHQPFARDGVAGVALPAVLWVLGVVDLEPLEAGHREDVQVREALVLAELERAGAAVHKDLVAARAARARRHYAVPRPRQRRLPRCQLRVPAPAVVKRDVLEVDARRLRHVAPRERRPAHEEGEPRRLVVGAFRCAQPGEAHGPAELVRAERGVDEGGLVGPGPGGDVILDQARDGGQAALPDAKVGPLAAEAAKGVPEPPAAHRRRPRHAHDGLRLGQLLVRPGPAALAVRREDA